MSTYDGVRRDVERLVKESCTDQALAKCSFLLDLAPIQSIARGEHSSARVYILRKFLKAVISGLDETRRTRRSRPPRSSSAYLLRKRGT